MTDTPAHTPATTDLDILYKALDPKNTDHSYTLNDSRIRIVSIPNTLRISEKTIQAVILILMWMIGILILDYFTDNMWLSVILSGLVVCAGSLLWALSHPHYLSSNQVISLKPDIVTTLDFTIPPHIIAAYGTDTYHDVAKRCIDMLYSINQDTLLNKQEKHMFSQRCIDITSRKINDVHIIRRDTLGEYLDMWTERIDEL